MQDSLYICSIITKQVIYGKDHCIFKSEGWCRQEYFVLSLCPLPRSKEPESCCTRCRPFPPGYVLIDCPGTLNDPALLKVFQAADAAVIPFRYDDFMIDSTFTFTKVLMKEAPQAKKIYVPNIIKMGVRYALQDSATEMFSKAGVVTFRVKDGVAIQRLSTLYAQDQYQEAATAGAFNTIYEVVR